jgi:hypothetical protein
MAWSNDEGNTNKQRYDRIKKRKVAWLGQTMKVTPTNNDTTEKKKRKVRRERGKKRTKPQSSDSPLSYP